MKQSYFVILLILMMLPLCALPILSPADGFVAGRIRVPKADVHAEFTMISHGLDCGCCGMLYNGGIVYTTADMSAVQLYDTGFFVTVDEDSQALECVEIVPCIRVGKYLIGWRGVVKPQGDVLVFSRSRAYRFTML